MLKSINIKNVLIAILVLFVIWAALFIYSNPVIGIGAEKMESHAREIWTERGYLEPDWQVAKAENDMLGVYLFYDTDTKDYAYTIYENYPEWYSFGYFSTGLSYNNEYVEETIQGYSDYGNATMLISMNAPQIARIEYGSETERTVIEVNAEQPFVELIPQDYGEFVFYDKDGNVIPLAYFGTDVSFAFSDK